MARTSASSFSSSSFSTWAGSSAGSSTGAEAFFLPFVLGASSLAFVVFFRAGLGAGVALTGLDFFAEAGEASSAALRLPFVAGFSALGAGLAGSLLYVCFFSFLLGQLASARDACHRFVQYSFGFASVRRCRAHQVLLWLHPRCKPCLVLVGRGATLLAVDSASTRCSSRFYHHHRQRPPRRPCDLHIFPLDYYSCCRHVMRPAAAPV